MPETAGTGVKDEGTQQIAIRPDLRRSRREIPTLIVYDGDEIGAIHPLTKAESVIGRTPEADIVIPETQVSRRHAMVRCADQENQIWEVRDLGSTNGTCLDGSPINSAPLRDGDKISIGNSILKFAFLDQHDLNYQQRIAEMIHVDDLTGLLTKRSLYRALEKELLRAGRYGRPIAVLMMDLDFFKKVNDTHGHLVGSACLAGVGKLIRETTRTIDVNGRYGGEEFISFLPETGAEEAQVVAERVRRALDERGFEHDGKPYEVRISIGISLFPDHGRTIESLVHAADLALYRAKETGRNKVVMFDHDLVEV